MYALRIPHKKTQLFQNSSQATKAVLGEVAGCRLPEGAKLTAVSCDESLTEREIEGLLANHGKASDLIGHGQKVTFTFTLPDGRKHVRSTEYVRDSNKKPPYAKVLPCGVF
jgi:hypothetical protein